VNGIVSTATGEGIATMRWRIRKSFRIFAPGNSLQKRVAYSLAIVRLILVPVIFLAVYYLFAMGRIGDRIVNTDAPAAKLAEQAAIETMEARRAARNYVLLQDPEYLQANQNSLTSVQKILVNVGELEPEDEAIVRQGIDAVTLYQQQFAKEASTMARSRQEPVERIRAMVRAYEADLDKLVREFKHEKKGKMIQELRASVGTFDNRMAGATQMLNPALDQVTPELQESSGKILQVASELEKRNWGRVQADHEKARELIHRAEKSLTIVSAITLLFSVWVSFILPRQVIKPLVSLREAVDHAATGNYEVEFELLGSGEVVELARSVQNLITASREKAMKHVVPAAGT
jgi:CHASE3 domain sensor protein